ncbi:MAG: hypothetical protein ABIR55_04015 [Burkholderiaceae bacterium]
MTDTPCAKAIYWKALPGQFDAYTSYLRDEVEPIDHEAQRRGVLTRFCTLVDSRPDAPWTHMRVFEFSSTQQRDALVPALAAIVAELTPDGATRAQRSARANGLRERVGEADLGLLA